MKIFKAIIVAICLIFSTMSFLSYCDSSDAPADIYFNSDEVKFKNRTTEKNSGVLVVGIVSLVIGFAVLGSFNKNKPNQNNENNQKKIPL